MPKPKYRIVGRAIVGAGESAMETEFVAPNDPRAEWWLIEEFGPRVVYGRPVTDWFLMEDHDGFETFEQAQAALLAL